MELIDNKIYTVAELIEGMDTCRKTVDRDIRRGRLPKPVKVGGKLQWLGSVLKEHFEHQHAKAGRR